ncbi:alpha/beta hydrolase [Streptomyces sp. DSM 44915]|uniref:Alpha/beta hydrolase n=1 Tax=Streptomyces chisholmiae TaxID=3075540 RepID=A0ABU2JVS1_9ACTN|nr:alpha/beta hydrolase [Streptomyces sp. DSM 44915]MDT0268639.1 alpha/beta hydrolase [Streptomyces sp. DSM 44915]
MTGAEIEFPVVDGVLSGVDFGGRGAGVLLVHGSGHNAAAWTDVASHLVGECHPVAFDLRGHGQTRLDSTHPEQYWRDLAGVVTSLAWDRPVLVGHSTGGYAVTAAAASGLVEPAALCVVDGVVLDDRDASLAAHADMRTAEAAERLRTMFRYGWEADDDEMRAYVERCVREAGGDWLNAGARPGLVEEVTRRSFTRRSFTRRGRGWVRRPAIEEVATVAAVQPGADVFPAVDVYARLTCPMTIVLAEDGFYASRRDEVRAVVDAAPDRRLIDIGSHHNVPMTRPADLAAIILDLVRDRAAPSAGNVG